MVREIRDLRNWPRPKTTTGVPLYSSATAVPLYNVVNLKTNHFWAIWLPVAFKDILSMLFKNTRNFKILQTWLNLIAQFQWKSKTKTGKTNAFHAEKNMVRKSFKGENVLFYMLSNNVAQRLSLLRLQRCIADIRERVLQFWAYGVNAHMWLSLRPQIWSLGNCTWPAINYVLQGCEKGHNHMEKVRRPGSFLKVILHWKSFEYQTLTYRLERWICVETRISGLVL